MNPDDLIALNEQIAAMARAGLPLDQGLHSLAQDMGRGRLRTVTEALAADLRAGHPLPEALARQQGRVPPYYAALVTAGVRTGRLPQVLATLSAYARTVVVTRTILFDALFYPALVLVFGLGLVVAMTVFILPQFQAIFADFGLALPWLTEFVLWFGQDPVRRVALPAALLVLCVPAVWLACRFSPGGRLVWSRFVYTVPLFGPLIRAARLEAFADLLATMVENEVPLPAAFDLAGAACADPLMARQSRQVGEALAAGVALGDAFRAGRGLVPEWVAWLAATGEKRGGLAQMLREIAGVYRRQVQSRAAMLRTVFPPLVIIVTAGFLTGVFIVALMLPLFKLLEGLSK